MCKENRVVQLVLVLRSPENSTRYFSKNR